MIIEICTDGSYDLRPLNDFGIKRIELCSALSVGGLTPTKSLVKKVRGEFEGDVFCMIRPRSGGFRYSKAEIEMMKNDIEELASLDIQGVVFGVLNGFSKIDITINSELLKLANNLNLQTTFHRAFDLLEDPMDGLDSLEALGFDYLLTSGGKEKAIDGIPIIDVLFQRSTNLKIIAGSGINSQNVDKFIDLGIDGVHFTASREIDEFKLGFGFEYILNEDKIHSIMNQINDK